jgi:hypothetical protein
MARRNARARTPDPAEATASPCDDWDDAPRGGNAVSAVVIAFGFMVGCTLLALLVGVSAVSALLYGWIAALSLIIVAIVVSGVRDWFESRFSPKVTQPRVRPEFAAWDADAKAERVTAETVAAWDRDMIIDAVAVDQRKQA